jgi:hypothetical protein
VYVGLADIFVDRVVSDEAHAAKLIRLRVQIFVGIGNLRKQSAARLCSIFVSRTGFGKRRLIHRAVGAREFDGFQKRDLRRVSGGRSLCRKSGGNASRVRLRLWRRGFLLRQHADLRKRRQ